MRAPLTLGTAGHIDHGKTALVGRLTGVDTDRLAEEKARGISIVLGYAALELPGGPRLSVVDVPGHERLVRTMIAGASGIDLFLLVLAADDGPMPQTLEHLRVLSALGVSRGAVAVTKADLADPGGALRAAAELCPGAPAVACSARTGAGIGELRAALATVARAVPDRARATEPAVLHVDRAFSVRGAGTVVTGTLWAGEISRGQTLRLLPAEKAVRVRGIQVHDQPLERAGAGQRVAVNLAGLDLEEVARGDVLAGPDSDLRPSHVLEAELELAELSPRERVHVHHGTRETLARLRPLGEGRWRVLAEHPLLAARGDRMVVRRISPRDTVGGGVVTEPHPRRASRPQEVAPAPPPRALPELGAGALELERRLLAAGHEPPSEAELGEAAAEIAALRAHGRALRVGRAMYAHPAAIAAVREAVVRIVGAEGSITLARLRDELHTSRRYAQALLEHLDATRVTRRLPDDRRVLRGSSQVARPG